MFKVIVTHSSSQGILQLQKISDSLHWLVHHNNQKIGHNSQTYRVQTDAAFKTCKDILLKGELS